MNFFDIIGYIAIIFSLLGFLTENKKHMLFYGIIATFLFGVSIFSYGGYNGLIVSIISILVKILSLTISEKKKKYLNYGAPIIAFIVFLFLPEGIEGIIPALSLFFIIGADTQKDVLKMKYWYYGSNLLWLSYGIILGSISAILFDVFGFFALTYGIYNILQKRKNNINDKK